MDRSSFGSGKIARMRLAEQASEPCLRETLHPLRRMLRQRFVPAVTRWTTHLPPPEMRTLRAALCAFVFAAPSALAAQVIDLTIHDVGLAIGDKPRMTGLRLNFRDAHLD